MSRMDGHLRNIAGSFLYADDVVDFREALQRGWFDVDAGAAGNVVENDRQLDGRGDGLEMLVKAFLRGLVVIRADGKDAVCAELLEFESQLDDVRGVVSAGAGQHGNLAARFVDGDFHDAALLGMRERGAFAGGAAGDQEVDAAVDLAAHQPANRFFIERKIRGETG